MDLGLALLRLLLAALLFGHSTQKLLGWFHGAGRTGTAQVFEQWGFVPGLRLVVVAGVAELAGAASLALGRLTPGGSAVIIGTMAVAAVATASNGFWAQRGGCEVPFCYGALALVLAFTGPGAWSVDHALNLTFGPWWGLGALALGLLAAAVPLTARARVLRAWPTTTTR
ncbi:DoxX family protein [Amycolatopsis thermoflava]|uniref:DoxX family protein n=1 Tax=Amycolatopsis thermoflava TaxID=84480 RepID=UPI0036646075